MNERISPKRNLKKSSFHRTIIELLLVVFRGMDIKMTTKTKRHKGDVKVDDFYL